MYITGTFHMNDRTPPFLIGNSLRSILHFMIMGVKTAVDREERYRKSVDEMSKKGKIMPNQHIHLGGTCAGKLKPMGNNCYLIYAQQGMELAGQAYTVFFMKV